jgi:hypothetical protein
MSLYFCYSKNLNRKTGNDWHNIVKVNNVLYEQSVRIHDLRQMFDVQTSTLLGKKV